MKKVSFKSVIVLFFVSVIVIIIVAFFSSRISSESSQMISETSQQRMVALSMAVSEMVTADEMEAFQTPADMKKPEYQALQHELQVFVSNADIEYAYFLRLDDNNMMQFIIGNGEGEGTGLAEPPVGREAAPDRALEGQATAVPLGSYSEGWEGYLTAFAPVYYSDGRLSNIVAGVDLHDVYIFQAQRNAIQQSWIMVIALIVVMASSLITLYLYYRKVKQAEAAGDAKTMFISNVSHEIRTPMNAIMGMTQIGKKVDDIPQARKYFQTIDDAAQHMLGILNDVLDSSKIESSKFVLVPEEVSLDNILNRAKTVVGVKMEDKHLDFVINVDPKVPDSLVVDAKRLVQVLNNLLSNALKFTGEGGTITLSVQLDKDGDGSVTLLFAVRDTGIGIAKEQQENLFQAFQQADNTISSRFGGTGLGLAISKGIVESMGGRIWIESELGVGSTFSFTIKVPKGHGSAYPGANAEIDWHAKHFILLSDREDSDKLMSAVKTLGAAIEWVDQPRELFTRLEDNQHADIVFLDAATLGEEINQLAANIKNEYPRVCTFYICGDVAWRNIQSEAMAAGASGYVSRPVLLTSLVDVLETSTCVNRDRSAVKQELDPTVGLFSGQRILVAEDMAINQEVIKSLLKDTDVTIDFAENGQEAVAMFRANPNYGLIFMDIQMPVMDGYAATREIREADLPEAQTIPIIAMTGSTMRDDIERCLACGMDDHIGKPIIVEAVIELMQKYLSAPSRGPELDS